MLHNPNNNNHKSNSCSNINTYYTNYYYMANNYLMSNPNFGMYRPAMSYMTVNQLQQSHLKPKNNLS